MSPTVSLISMVKLTTLPALIVIVMESEQNPFVACISNVLFTKAPVWFVFIRHQSTVSLSDILELTFTTSFILGAVLFIPIVTFATVSLMVKAVLFTGLPKSVPSLGVASNLIASFFTKLLLANDVVVSPPITASFLYHLYVLPLSPSPSASE